MNSENNQENVQEEQTVKQQTEPDTNSLQDALSWKLVAINGFVTAIIITLLATNTNPLDLITTEVIVFILFLFLGFVFLAPVTIASIKRVWSPPVSYVLDLDASKDDPVEDLYYASPEKVEELNVTEGKLQQEFKYGRVLSVGRDFDVTNQTIVGTWGGLASDAEMIVNKWLIHANRGALRRNAKKGREIEAKLPAIYETIENNAWGSITGGVTDAVVQNPHLLRQSLSQEIESYDIEQPQSFNTRTAQDILEEMDIEEVGGSDE